MALHGLPVAIHSGGGGPDRSQPVQNEIGEKLFWTRLILKAAETRIAGSEIGLPEQEPNLAAGESLQA
jgi:hypothetical protein